LTEEGFLLYIIQSQNNGVADMSKKISLSVALPDAQYEALRRKFASRAKSNTDGVITVGGYQAVPALSLPRYAGRQNWESHWAIFEPEAGADHGMRFQRGISVGTVDEITLELAGHALDNPVDNDIRAEIIKTAHFAHVYR
jgi:hypothetical protein